MENQGVKETSNNVIPFPNLNNRLLERGIQALKEKNYKKAMLLFEQLTRLEPDHAQASYGLAVCYVELEQYSKAEELTATMMRQDIGDYYDVLKLHITILIQQHEYEKVVSTIQAVLSEDSPTEQVKETLVHLAEFAKVRMTEEHFDDALHLTNSFSPNIKKDLESDKVERQWRGIEKGRAFITDTVLQDYFDYLKSDQGDPFLKSMVIKIVIEHGYEGPLTVTKFNTSFSVDVKETQLFYEGFSHLVDDLLEQALGSENPSLLESAVQIWGHFTIAVYPKPLEPNLPNVWAACCYCLAHQVHGLTVDYSHLQSLFDVTKESLAKPLSLLKAIEENELHFE